MDRESGVMVSDYSKKPKIHPQVNRMIWETNSFRL